MSWGDAVVVLVLCVIVSLLFSDGGWSVEDEIRYRKTFCIDPFKNECDDGSTLSERHARYRKKES